MKLIIDTEKLKDLEVQAGKVALTMDAEQYLLRLMYVRWLADHYIDLAKQQIATEGEELMPSFKGMVGDTIKATYRSYGARYKYVDDGLIKPDPAFVSTKQSFTVNNEAVETYFNATGKLPAGLVENERTKTISFNETDIIKKFESGELDLLTLSGSEVKELDVKN